MALLVLLALTASTVLSSPSGKYFDRILVIMFENQYIDDTLQHPYFKQLTTNGTLLSQYYGVTHPSQPNYVAQLAGSFFNIKTDNYVTLNHTNLVDLMEPKGLTWKSYQEDFPKDHVCFDGVEHKKLYYRKHNPFILFDNIRKHKHRCANIVNADQLEIDLKNNELPNLMYYTPNIDNDAHNTGLAYADKYLHNFLPHYLTSSTFMKNTLIFITFDEDDYKGDNRVYTVLLGSMVKPGAVDSNHYNHYSLTKTIQENWDLGSLGRNDASADAFKCFVKN